MLLIKVQYLSKYSPASLKCLKKLLRGINQFIIAEPRLFSHTPSVLVFHVSPWDSFTWRKVVPIKRVTLSAMSTLVSINLYKKKFTVAKSKKQCLHWHA